MTTGGSNILADDIPTHIGRGAARGEARSDDADLRGPALCADRLGHHAEADAAFNAAAGSDSLFTEDGRPVRKLAQARLGELQRRTGAQ